jgi:hypothetical protein
LERGFDFELPVVGGPDGDVQLLGELFAGLDDLAVEVRAEAMDGERADDESECAQDRERQERRDAGQTDADWQAVERV